MEKYKTCTKCKEIKAVVLFNKDNRSKGGLRSECKTCQKHYHNKYHAKNRVSILESKKRYRVDNKYVIAEKKKQRYTDNKEDILKYNSQYYAKNRDTVLENQKKYYIDNNELILANVKQYRTENPEKIYAQNQVHSHIKNKPSQCEYCKKVNTLDAHHHDYNQPLNVTFLCKTCHMMLHKGKTQEAEKIRTFIEIKFNQ